MVSGTGNLWRSAALIAALLLTAALGVWLWPTSVTPAASDALPLPVFDPPGGYYDRAINLRVTAPGRGLRVVFTTDGHVPTATVGAIFSQTLVLPAAPPSVTVIRARVVDAQGRWGPPAAASYFVGLEAQLPLLSLVVEPEDLWDWPHGIYAAPLNHGSDWERPALATFIDADRTSGFQMAAGLRIHGHQSRAFIKKSFRLYFRDAYGAARLDYPLFPGSEVQSFKRLVIHNGGQDWPFPPLRNWTLMRNQLAARLAFDVGGYATRSRAVLLFINGELWGIYQLRERMDADFLADHYGFADADFLEAPESCMRDTLMGDRVQWDALLEFVLNHELTDPAAYAYVLSQIDVENFIDYYILQMYSANTDWPARNLHQFRPRVPGGRWHWMFWDSDNGFAADTYSKIDSNMVAHLLDYNHPETQGRDVALFRKLMQNPDFFNRFAVRLADLLNTTLAPAAVTAHIDALAAELSPDIAYESTRWPAPSVWEEHVAQLRDFAARRPDLMRQHFSERFNLGGAALLTVNRPASGKGTLALNGREVTLPWSGVYFQGIPLVATALPAPGYRFVGWEGTNLTASAWLTLTLSGPVTLTPRFEPVNQAVAGAVAFAAVHADARDAIYGDWFELRVLRSVDLRGWRITDNDTVTATDEGSLILPDHPALAWAPPGTRVRILATADARNAAAFPQDDVSFWGDGVLVFYVGNGLLETGRDPWFNLGAVDNLAALAPGATTEFADDQVAACWGHSGVTPASFSGLCLSNGAPH